MTSKRLRLTTLTLSGLMLSSALTAGVAVAGATDPLHILFVNFSNSSDPFQAVITKGAEDAAKQQGVQLDLKFAEGDLVNQNNILETGIANKVDGIITSVPNDDAFNAVLCKASNAGIPVVLMNIDHSKGKAGGTCRLAFVGQNFVAAGYAIGKRMIDQFHLKKGDLVFTPVEFPEAVYAVQRHEGVQKALDEVGAKSEMLGVGTDGGQALTLMTQYLVGHPATAAVIGLGQTPTSQAVEAIKEAKLNIPAGGFDLSQNIVDGIESGSLAATVDQQPYSQGYFSVAQIALLKKYGLYPSDMNTGGDGLIDKTNVGLAKTWAGQTR